MHKLTVIYPSSSNPERFKKYYVENHLPLARKMPGLRRMEYSFDLQALGPSPAPFCVFEAWFDDATAFAAASQSPEGQAVAADVANFADGPPTIFHGPVTES